MPEFFVPGIAQPQGSKSRGRHGGLYEDNKALGSWRELVKLAAAEQVDEPTREAVVVSARFVFPRPAGHFRVNGGLRASARPHPSVKPDIDKLERALLDALTGVAIVDDAQVCEVHKAKVYGNRPGVSVVWNEL